MDWKTSLDHWLTTPPDDGFDDYYEEVINGLSDPFFDENEDWINEYDGQFNKWLNVCCSRGFSPNKASQIIERAYRLYYDKERP